MEQTYSHPAFPQPNDPSITIWRYMDFNKFEWLINCSRLYMSSADKLGDPLEGSPPTGNLEWWRRKASEAETSEQKRIIEHNHYLLSGMAKKFCSHYYVSCWHMNQYENLAMWQYYTTQPNAVAIRTTYITLRECLPDYVDMGLVRYIDYATERLPTMNIFEYITHKHNHFSIEQEVRAVAFPPPVEGLGLSDFQKNLFESESSPKFIIFAPPVDLKHLIHGIVLHPDAPPAFEAEMIKLCLKNGLVKPELFRRDRESIS